MFFSGACSFQAISLEECPCSDGMPYSEGYGLNDDYMDYRDDSGCRIEVDCNQILNYGDLCEADDTLPDGNYNFDIDNCPGNYDVFKCVNGK